MFDQKIPAWLMKTMFLREVEIAVRSVLNLGLLSWAFSRSDAGWARGFLFNGVYQLLRSMVFNIHGLLHVGLPGEQREKVKSTTFQGSLVTRVLDVSETGSTSWTCKV